MSRINTQSNVATVANTKAIGDRSVMEFKRKAVNKHRLACFSKGTIAAIAFGTSPQPTSILLISSGYVMPERLLGIASGTGIVSVDKPSRFSANHASSSMGLFGNRSTLPAATMAKAVRATKVEGKLNRGCYTGHISAPYPSANRARGVHSAAWIRHAQYTSPRLNRQTVSPGGCSSFHLPGPNPKGK